MLKFVDEPYRTMVLAAQCVGLRIGEVMAVQWSDFDFANLTGSDSAGDPLRAS